MEILGTPIKFHECYSMVNDTKWWGTSCTCARASFKGAFLVKESALLNLNIAISTILVQGSAIKQCRPLVIKAPMPWHKLLSLESMRSGWVGWKEFGCGISDMRFVCPRTFVNSTRTAGPIVTGEAPFDSPIRRNDDGADLGSISSTWHVARAAPSKLAKKFAPTYRSNGRHHRP